ncbi:hypothetical protein STSP2_03131 [Anaerohalosphaera lusitana]|uniref:Uncharacterized protein n=1 Tax=Anaerohalosphaera lusitana TaxID=1936003 RepID=A0A1U9NPS7_9BACT|nr:hypothetical protein [Anaerohalosphaera lusitana]AQT69931.1 hypothetical protein STSP2_03131 [Anaerohalosphaera lusitana]
MRWIIVSAAFFGIAIVFAAACRDIKRTLERTKGAAKMKKRNKNKNKKNLAAQIYERGFELGMQGYTFQEYLREREKIRRELGGRLTGGQMEDVVQELRNGVVEGAECRLGKKQDESAADANDAVQRMFADGGMFADAVLSGDVGSGDCETMLEALGFLKAGPVTGSITPYDRADGVQFGRVLKDLCREQDEHMTITAKAKYLSIFENTFGERRWPEIKARMAERYGGKQ